MIPLQQPNANKHIKTVSSFAELVQLPFIGNINAACWDRKSVGNFKEIVDQLVLKENITEVTTQDLRDLSLTKDGNIAREVILSDLQLLAEFGAQPTLNLLKCYDRDDELGFISTDVYSFHVDRSPIATDTYLCTYYGAASDIIANDDAVQKILIPQVREKLRALHDGDDHDFENFLQEYFFDLHYEAKPTATPINLGNGNLWRLAVDHPQQQVLPCIHRAPTENIGQYRLLLIC